MYMDSKYHYTKKIILVYYIFCNQGFKDLNERENHFKDIYSKKKIIVNNYCPKCLFWVTIDLRLFTPI